MISVTDSVSPPVSSFALAAAASISALTFFPALRAPRHFRGMLLVLACAAILATPWIITPGARLLRCLAAILAVTLSIKLYDLHVGAARGVRPSFLGFLGFLPNIYALVHRRLDDEPRPPRDLELRRAALTALIGGAAGAVFLATFRIDWARYNFAREHAVKVVALFLALVPLANFGASLWRLAGGRGGDFMDNPFAARTPADFWRRYNRPVHQFIEHDVFTPAGGRRSPCRAAVAAFVVSAVIHEYVFFVPVGRVLGYQTAFFLVQGLAAAITLRLRPRGIAAAASIAATFAFNLATGILFFASVDQVLPFYVNDVPVW